MKTSNSQQPCCIPYDLFVSEKDLSVRKKERWIHKRLGGVSYITKENEGNFRSQSLQYLPLFLKQFPTVIKATVNIILYSRQYSYQ